MKSRVALAINLVADLVNQIYVHSLSHPGKISYLQNNSNVLVFIEMIKIFLSRTIRNITLV